MATLKTNMQGYVKDTQTGVVTNVDKAALMDHKFKVSRAKDFKRLTAKVEELEERIKKLEAASLSFESTYHYPPQNEHPFPFAQYTAGGIVDGR